MERKSKRIRSFHQKQPLARAHQTQIAETTNLSSYDKLRSNSTEVKEKLTKTILVGLSSFPTITNSGELVKRNLQSAALCDLRPSAFSFNIYNTNMVD